MHQLALGEIVLITQKKNNYKSLEHFLIFETNLKRILPMATKTSSISISKS